MFSHFSSSMYAHLDIYAWMYVRKKAHTPTPTPAHVPSPARPSPTHTKGMFERFWSFKHTRMKYMNICTCLHIQKTFEHSSVPIYAHMYESMSVRICGCVSMCAVSMKVVPNSDYRHVRPLLVVHALLYTHGHKCAHTHTHVPGMSPQQEANPISVNLS